MRDSFGNLCIGIITLLKCSVAPSEEAPVLISIEMSILRTYSNLHDKIWGKNAFKCSKSSMKCTVANLKKIFHSYITRAEDQTSKIPICMDYPKTSSISEELLWCPTFKCQCQAELFDHHFQSIKLWKITDLIQGRL